MKNLKNKNGITLIALIVTIVIMLILASVTIKIAKDGGLFDYAKKAKNETENAIGYEQELINEIYNLVDDNVNDTGGGNTDENRTLPYNETKKNANGCVIANATYESNGKTAIIPIGFKVSEKSDEQSIDGGLVIQDKDGNEFVWVPVTFGVTKESVKNENGLYPEFLAVFYRSDWSSNARTTNLDITTYTEPYASGYTTPTTESADYYEMMRSVQENKGFYIGRYEAGIKTTENPRTKSTIGSNNMVVQRDCYPYTYVGWGNIMKDYVSDVIFDKQNGSNHGKGALYLSKYMYDEKDIGAKSTLCYGIQWDAMLEFIKDSTHDVTNSTDWGNYKDNSWTITRTEAKFSADNGETWSKVPTEGKSKTSSEQILLTTGADDSFASKNIYDIAGNVSERTNEVFSSSNRVDRGGGFRYNGVERPGSYRTYGVPYYCGYFVGFRPTLYIKN